MPGDVSSLSDVRRIVGGVVKKWGGLDCKYNSAGIEGEIAPLVDQGKEECNQVFAVNALGVLFCLQEEVKAMLARGGGAIVNVASIAAIKGIRGAGPYTASKHPVLGLTRAAALDYAANGIRINAVCPALAQTHMAERLAAKLKAKLGDLTAKNPMGKPVSAEEVATVIGWLLSGASETITGAALSIDGGASIT